MTLNPSALALFRALLRGLQALNLVYGIGIVLLLVASLVAAEPTLLALGIRLPPDNGAVVLGLRGIMLTGIAGAAVAHVLLTQLLAIVDSVRAGDPFIASNARRLQLIAWCVLAGELLRLAVGAIAGVPAIAALGMDIEAGFSFAPWLTVLLLFVLARVFDHGTRLRADLEGTV